MTDENKNKKNLAIIGLGLLGTSLGMALRGGNYRRIGWSRRVEVRQWAIEQDVIDETYDNVEDLLNKVDITILCLPVPEIMNFMIKYAACWKKGSIVTDIGSVKQVIVECGEAHLEPKGVHFIGSHPMAGTEKSGPEAAFPSLYDNAEVFVTYTGASDPKALEAVIDFWRSVKVKTVKIGTREHDILVAHTSHVLHVVALALAQAVLDCPDEDEKMLRFSGCATGFRDTSRIASSSPRMWREIIENNQDAALETIKSFEKRWQHLRDIIEKKDFDQFEREFAHGKELRDEWVEYKKNKK